LQFEVEVKTVSTRYILVEAKNVEQARQFWRSGAENAEFVESEEIVAVIPYDERFDDDELTDEYVEEEFEYDE
jgi:hypothetical protein